MTAADECQNDKIAGAELGAYFCPPCRVLEGNDIVNQLVDVAECDGRVVQLLRQALAERIEGFSRQRRHLVFRGQFD